MSQFENITIIREVNAYFDGKVTSRTLLFPDGTRKTLGVMLPGEFEFGTEDAEIMEIMSGELEINLPGGSGWQTIKGGESFEVPASSRFQLKVHSITDYCCSYI